LSLSPAPDERPLVALPDAAALAEAMGDARGDGDGAGAEEVEVPRRPVEVALPQDEQHRALDDEPLAVGRLPQPVEEALQDVAGEERLEVPALGAGAVEEPLADGRGLARLCAHATASR
jgi:hypothetical protein